MAHRSKLIYHYLWRVTLHVGSELSDELFHQGLYLQDQAVNLINKVGKSLVANESFLNGL